MTHLGEHACAHSMIDGFTQPADPMTKFYVEVALFERRSQFVLGNFHTYSIPHYCVSLLDRPCSSNLESD